jgi:hypothetical protein
MRITFGTAKANKLFAELVPLGFVTSMLAVPAAELGVITVRAVSLTTVKFVADMPPIVTLVAPVKFTPVTVIYVPPEVVPAGGTTDDTTGIAIKMHLRLFPC